jgi:putative oxidoreductase
LIDWWRGKISYPDPLGLGESLTMLVMGSIEAICPVFVIVGLFTRIAGFFVAFGFVVAVLIAHASDPFGVRELAYMYMSGFLAVFLLGPGKFSVDNYLSKSSGR